jgi:hypothetical protein
MTKYSKIKDVWVDSEFMLCRNDECGVVLYDPRHDITGSCPGCDEVGTVIGKRTRGEQ